MKALVFVSVSVLVLLGCSHSRFVRQDPARGGLAEDRPRVEVTFRADGGIDSTSPVDCETKPVTVRAVAAKGRYLLASTKQLKTLTDTVHHEPAVDLLFAAMKEIRGEDRDLRPPSLGERLGRVPRWSLKGALGGLDTVGSLFPDLLAARSRRPGVPHGGVGGGRGRRCGALSPREAVLPRVPEDAAQLSQQRGLKA